MTLFRLIEFEDGRRLTLAYRGRVFGRAAVIYLVETARPDASRLLMKLRWKPPSPAVLGCALEATLLLADLVMARRQLLNLKALAERDARAG